MKFYTTIITDLHPYVVVGATNISLFLDSIKAAMVTNVNSNGSHSDEKQMFKVVLLESIYIYRSVGLRM